MEKKVSIITPCYNGELYLGRLLESVLKQSYPEIEMIVVNDGSKDSTESVALSYREKFEQREYSFIYITQENGGPAAAINTGLAVFSGDYLTWADSDDFFECQSIATQVAFLEEHDEYGWVRTDALVYDEKDLSHPIGFISQKSPLRFREELFDALVEEDNVYFAPGCNMVRTSAFLDVIPSRQIYAPRAGQNYQLMLPVALKYKCGYIDQALHNIVVRPDSHSHSVVTKDDLINACDLHENVLRTVVSSLNVDRAHYDRVIRDKYIRRKLTYAAVYRDSELGFRLYEKLLSSESLSFKDRLYYAMSQSRYFNYLGRGILKIRHMLEDRKAKKSLQ
ncbi:MAG: glycosyltransferase family A protein [Syntrophomonas sp.]